MKKVIITGISGQDGSYLAEFLLEKGYRVCGTVRKDVNANYEKIEHIRHKIILREWNLLDDALIDIISEVEPDEIYNLAAPSFVPDSWAEPILTSELTAIGVTRLLESVRHVNPYLRVYQASSSEMFGTIKHAPQNEDTPFFPCTPYGISKVYGHFMATNYRERYGMFCCSGILFNHESPRRGMEFVTRKVSRRVAMIKLNLQSKLRLGNLKARRDWGFAGDYVKAMWLMLQQDNPQDFVIGTGVHHSVEELVQVAFKTANLDWKDHVKVDEQLYRPDGRNLVADASKARKVLGWYPETSFEKLVQMMVEEDIKKIQADQNNIECLGYEG